MDFVTTPEQYVEFITFYPEFAHSAQPRLTEDIVKMFMDLARVHIDPVDECWRMLNGAALRLALYLMAAHLIALFLERQQAILMGDPSAASPGFVQSASIDGVSVTKATIPARDAWDYWLESTPYGLELLALLQSVTAGGTFVGGLPERDAFRKVYGVF